ncbi:MAG TPA: lipid-A-disaccharide synthase-related protein [Leptolyngbyaceae cyanobacterium]
MSKRILFLSNGHGEDLNASLVLKALQQIAPDIEVAALPIVGDGNAYRRLGVPIVGPTQRLPSGGFNYINFARLLNPVNWFRDLNPLNLLKDVFSGLLALTWDQFQAVRRYSQDCDLLFATGDVVPILFAYLTGRPFMAFLVSTSSYYEGRAKVPLLAMLGLRSHRCAHIFTRDAFTAQDLQGRGLSKAHFSGYPIMDVLTPTGKDLHLVPHQPMIALLPGSRLPEALHNFALQLQLCEILAQKQPIQFQAALVPSITDDHLQALADQQGWYLKENGHLVKGEVHVFCHSDAFSDILQACDLAVGMAGTAVEQAVGLGKPVVQIIGAGPQFTYPFAEAQMRLLGLSVVTIGKWAATPTLLEEAANTITPLLKDVDYAQRCMKNGRERVGEPGGSTKIASYLVNYLLENPQLEEAVP